MSEALPWLEVALDDQVQGIAERTSFWSKGTRTFRVDLARLGRVAVQVGRPEHRQRIQRRVSASRFLVAAAPQLRVPEVITDGTDAAMPFVVTRWVQGRPLSSLLGTPAGSMRIAVRLHAVLGELSRLPAAPADLPTAWADPDGLRQAAVEWLDRVASRLDAGTLRAVSDCVERTTALDFASRGFAHGDVVPMNVLIDQRGVVTILDFEDARVAPASFDRAMAWTTLALHHPEAAIALASLTANPQAEPSSRVDLDGLAVTGCLQRLERARDSLAGLGDETAAIGELVRAAELVTRFRLPSPG